ncbi:amino acid ABC transporter permease [Nocardioides yefusunii]|uniref:Amino acid ABC transporter permease n=1 Tax=Nocardioides yefusunii TaxID=2500546 RepID=A0ABW1R096_9ACTN|nr:amino acid ABC transporter permease [Nocardioides yefusunii]
MSAGVLFDAPGPRTKVRHRIYGVLALVALVALVGVVAKRLYDYGQFEYSLWEYFVTPDYLRVIFSALLDTLAMAVFAIVLAVVFGVLFGIGKLSDHVWVRWPCWLVVEFFRAVPVLLMMIFFFFWFSIGGGPLTPFWVVVVSLTLYNGSVLAEVVRAGINAVPRGQAEAAYAIGMRKTQVMTHVQLPQGVKMMLPALISQMVVALKDTSLGYYITAPGLTYAYKIISTEGRNHIPTAIVVTALYIAVNLLLTWLATVVQKKLVGEKKILDVPAAGAAGDASSGAKVG